VIKQTFEVAQEATPMKQSAESRKGVQHLLWDDLFDLPVAVEFGPQPQTCNAGLLLLGALDRRTGFTERLATALRDYRTGEGTHALEDFLRQRLFGMAGGYADANDAAQLRDEPIFRLLVNRGLEEEDGLASQPTLSRFENGIGLGSQMRMGHYLADYVLRQQRKRVGRVPRVTLDLDPTDDQAHGQQVFSFFNGHYGHRVFLPVLAFITFHDQQNREEAERYLLTALLRGGDAVATVGAEGLLRRLVAKVRRVFPEAKIRVRLDGGYAAPELFELLDELRVEYVVNMGKNEVLKREAEPHMIRARIGATLSGKSERVFGECRYSAGTWKGTQRRVVIKAEVTIDPAAPDKGMKDNPRFVVTNLRSAPEKVYAGVYCPRGSVEKHIEEIKNGCYLGRTSCTDFLANQFRVLLAAAAYVLLQEARTTARKTEAGTWRMENWRGRLLKVAGLVWRSTRRWVIRIYEGAPDAGLFRQLAQLFGAYATG
jgi:hypothetical protein